MTAHDFRLAGQRRFTTARAALIENSRNALADIGDRIGDATLSRTLRLAELREALDRGRYLEIQGDAGVGKSGLLKVLAAQVETEAGTIVLSPGRTALRGWTAMRAEIGFDGTARELLVDMAGDGAAVIFLDNLDQFTSEERNTVIDLIRTASEVPGVSIVSTARRPFSPEDRSWLPADALARLGHNGPVVVGELVDAEIVELRLAAPRLARLLSDAHPARDVVRNLYRLGRLAARAGAEPAPRTEIEMALLWWETADGARDADHRDRSRILRAFAQQSLAGSGPIDASDQPSKALDQLVLSESRRDLGVDRFSFRHDILRDWAIANLLSEDQALIERLPLHLPIPVTLARGIELCARIAIERSPDCLSWQSLLERLSRAGVHASWRRAVMLALVRSEIASELLTRASDLLFTGNASSLRELIRTTMAVDAVPAVQRAAAFGINPAIVPPTLNVPIGPSWYRLIVWLLSLGTRLPVAAIPDAVNLYADWSTGYFGWDALTPKLVPWLHFWLSEIENSRGRTAFGGQIAREKINELEFTLRSGFLTFCNKTPQLAADYLRDVIARPHNERIAESILNYRGTLAQAAPAELAELTMASLIRHKAPKRGEYDDEDRPFSSLDHQFIPQSPAQGPFYELLTFAPQYGLPLVRRLVETAVDFRSGGQPHGPNAIVVNFDDGPRAFPWRQTYNWSRSGSSNYYCVTSGLMALEAWAHKRIESGEDFVAVLGDVLGAPGATAAYLLVAVDIIISHWPKSAEAAAPFLASPGLLSIDREGQVHEWMPFPDLFGLGAMRKEPSGPATLRNLQDRPSRHRPLPDLLGLYAFGVPAELRKKLEDLLQVEAKRLGEPAVDADLRDPALMVRHALNLINPANWTDVEVARPDGSTARGRQYVSPALEANHLATLEGARGGERADAGVEARLGVALDDPSKSSNQLVMTAVDWAQRQPVAASPDDGDLRQSSIVTAAMIAMRDGDFDQRHTYRVWADGIFSAAMAGKEDPAHRFRGGLRFNPPAIAFAGRVHALKDELRPGDIRALLEMAAQSDPAAAHGLGSVAAHVAALDERLPRSLLRCAFAAAIRTRRHWDTPQGVMAKHDEGDRQQRAAAVSAELAWLDGSGPEPPWPTFPSEAPHTRPSIRLPGGPVVPPAPVAPRGDKYADHQAAALWLANCRGLFDAKARPWLFDLVRSYSGWTATANGAGLDAGEELNREPEYWNDAYFDALANCLPAMTSEDVDELALDPIRSLPDESFLDVFAIFIVAVDRVFFNGRGPATEEAVRIRSALAERLVDTGEWRRMAREKSSSIGMHLGPAAGAMFFNSHGFMRPAAAYLLPKAIERLVSFLPLLERLSEEAPCPFIAMVTLNLLEVAPRIEHAQILVMGAKSWLAAFPDDNDFWVEQGIGRRICNLLDVVLVKCDALFAAERGLRRDVDAILGGLVRSGVPEAARLERDIAGRGRTDV